MVARKKKLKMAGSKVARTRVLVIIPSPLVLWSGVQNHMQRVGHEIFLKHLSCIHPPTKKNQDLFILQPPVNHAILCRIVHFNTHKVGRGCLPTLINFASVSVQF